MFCIRFILYVQLNFSDCVFIMWHTRLEWTYTVQFPQFQGNPTLVWRNGWMFVYELYGCGFWSRCSHVPWLIWTKLSLLNFRETKAAGAHAFKVGVRERLLFGWSLKCLESFARLRASGQLPNFVLYYYYHCCYYKCNC